MATKTKTKSQNWQIQLVSSWCKGCYLCIDVCPIEGIFTKADEIGSQGFRPLIVDPDGCTGCLLCELMCPDLAITVEEDETED